MEDQGFPKELQLEIRDRIKEIAPAIQNYHDIKEGLENIAEKYDSEEMIFNLVSESGQVLEKQIHQIIKFWGKFPSFSFILKDPFVQLKIGINRIIKDDTYKKIGIFLERISKENKKKELKDNPFSLNQADLNLICSFSILLFCGLLEDYLSRLSKEVYKKTKYNIPNKFFGNLKKIQKTVLAMKASRFLEALNISEINFFDKELDKHDIIFCKANYHKFRHVRNKIAHSGQFDESIEFLKEAENISQVLKKESINQIESNPKYVMKEKELFKRLIDELGPFVTYLYVIYLQFLPYIILIDNVALIWTSYWSKES